MSRRSQNVVGLVKLAAGIALAVVAPPAAAAAAAITLARSARKFAQSGDPSDAQGLVSGYAALADPPKDGGKS